MAQRTLLAEVTRSHVVVGVVACEFCKNEIQCGHDAHYYVDGVGALCVSCLLRSHITLRGNKNYVTLTYTRQGNDHE
jgi:hypothetical protein